MRRSLGYEPIVIVDADHATIIALCTARLCKGLQSATPLIALSQPAVGDIDLCPI